MLEPLPLTSPVPLRIAADPLSGATDYADDQIWEVLAGGEPPALALTTSFGRRAVSMRIFASFGMGGPVVSDPSAFATPPLLEAILPSYLSLRFAPLAGLEVRAEYRVADSHTVTGRFTLTNTTDRFRPVRLGLHGVLAPNPGGQGLLPRSFSGATALAGSTAGLAPVLFLTGATIEEPGLMAGLLVRVDLAPGASRAYTWAGAASRDADVSFERARQTAGRPWDAEVARLERIHDRWVEVRSGDSSWDGAFHLAQQAALNALVGPGPLSSRLSLVRDRTPDRGFSPTGDGRDHSDGWDGPSALEAYCALLQMVWAAPEAAAEVVRSFWDSQGVGGAIDSRPGPSGQRSRLLCPPFLGILTLRIHEVLQDATFLEDGFRALWLSFRAWGTPAHDRDGDGWPEWDHAGHPPWALSWGGADPDEAIDTTFIEDPALAALLYREAAALEEMAKLLGRPEAVDELAARRQQLRGMLQRAWSAERRTFRRIDRETHRTSQAEEVARGRGPISRKASRQLTHPARLVVRIDTDHGAGHDVRLRIRGRVQSGRVRVETFGQDEIRWMWSKGTATTQLAFSSVEAIELQGLPEDAGWVISTLDLEPEDLTLLLPLWAGMVDPSQAEEIVRGTLLAPERYLQPAGLACVPRDDPSFDAASAHPRRAVSPALNLLLGEALVRYGYRKEAADLLRRILSDVLVGLRQDRGLHPAYHPETGSGLGRRNDLGGLPPLSLFLDVLGIGLQSPRRILLSGASPFDHPVTVRWRGVEIRRDPTETRIVFPSGRSARVEGSEGVLVEDLQAEG